MGVSRAVSNSRLLKLADFLDKLPRKRFDYEHWVGRDWKGAPDLSCGTTACALGWAATMPEFRRLGLHLHRSESDPSIGWVVNAKTASDSEDAASEVFGLSEEEAIYIFNPACPYLGYEPEREGWPISPPSTSTPKQVAKHIRRFVKARAA